MTLLACQTKPTPLLKWRHLNSRRYSVGRLLVWRDHVCFRTGFCFLRLMFEKEKNIQTYKKNICGHRKPFLRPHAVQATNLWRTSLRMLPAHIDIINLVYVGYNAGYSSVLLPCLSWWFPFTYTEIITHILSCYDHVAFFFVTIFIPVVMSSAAPVPLLPFHTKYIETLKGAYILSLLLQVFVLKI
jgi:hypothetical protein